MSPMTLSRPAHHVNGNGAVGSDETAKVFARQIDHVISVAGTLHASSVEGDFEAFQETCRAVGLEGEIGSQPAAQFYWDRMTRSRSGKPIAGARGNTDLSSALGIELRNGDTPRNRLLYHLFEVVVDGLFHAEITDGVHQGGKAGKRRQDIRRVRMFDVRDREMRCSPWKIRLSELFQGKTPADIIDERIAQKAQPLCDALGKKMGLKLGELLFKIQMILPDAMVAPLVGAILQRGLQGEEVILIGAFCPDYAYEATGNPSLPWRYTFDSLGEGVGLVALQFARVVPLLSHFLTELGIRHRVILGIGDFEADSADTLKRVGLTYDAFVEKCRRSLDAFREAIRPGVPLELELCDADRCKGRLRRYANDAVQRMMQGDFGRMSEVCGDPDEVVNRIVRDNGTFYKRWYSPDLTDDEIRRIVLTQGGEYAALSRIYSEDLGENVIVISGDRPEMHKFDDFFTVVPTLCVRRAY